MEQEFRTTFIPKKPVTEAPVTASSRISVGKPAGLLFTLALLVLIISGVLAGGVFVYHKTAADKTKSLLVQIEVIKNRLETESIQTYALLDKRIKNAETLLRQHTIMYPVYRTIEQTALPAVRYTKMDTTYNAETNAVTVNVSGEADSYRSIALQSQSLGNDGKFKNILFSNFVVSPQGQVTFDVSFTINKSDLLYPSYATPLGTNTSLFDENLIDDMSQDDFGSSSEMVETDSIDGLSF